MSLLAAQIEFKPRWREEIVATSPIGKLVFEFTVGRFHVYFPDQQRWYAAAPAWARDHWQPFHDACQQWCKQNRFPMTLEADAQFYEEK